MSSINKAFTKIPLDIWNSTRNNTNVIEASHSNINRDGIKLSLLTAIKKQVKLLLIYIIVLFPLIIINKLFL